MDNNQEQQRADEEQKLMRCLELYQKVDRGLKFFPKDLEDLRYFLGLPKERT